MAPVRPPRSPPNARGQRSVSSQPNSPAGRGSLSQRHSIVTNPGSSHGSPSTTPSDSSRGSSPMGPGRGGRAFLVRGIPVAAGRSRGRSASSARRSSAASPNDVPMAEARLVHDGVTTRAQAASAAVSAATVIPNPASQTPQLAAPASQLHRRTQPPSSSRPSPSRGGFQALLSAEVQALQAEERAQQTEDAVTGVTAATTPPGALDDQDMSDAATVATDNTEGSFVQMFVHQPVAASIPATIGGPTGPSPPTAPRRPPGPTLQPTNPYLRYELLPSRPVEARYEMRLQLAPSSNADAELCSTLVAFFTKIRKYDGTLVIHPWADRDNTTQQNGQRRWRALAKPEDIPATMDSLWHYFPRALPKPTGGFVYPSVHLGHSKSFESLKHDLAWWF